MAYKCIETEWKNKFNGFVNKFICDSEEDVKDLPASNPGSIAVVASKGGAVYVVNASGKWVVI